MSKKNQSTVIFVDFINVACALGQFFIIHLDEIFEYIASQINEEITNIKIIIVGFFEQEQYDIFEKIKEKYHLEIVSTKPTKTIKDPDDRIIRKKILEYSKKKDIKNIVIVSLDGGYFTNLKIASSQGKKIYIAANDRKNKKYSVFEFIDLEKIRTAYMLNIDCQIAYKSSLSMSFIYPDQNIQEVNEFMKNIELTYKEFINQSKVSSTFVKKIKKESSS